VARTAHNNNNNNHTKFHRDWRADRKEKMTHNSKTKLKEKKATKKTQ